MKSTTITNGNRMVFQYFEGYCGEKGIDFNRQEIFMLLANESSSLMIAAGVNPDRFSTDENGVEYVMEGTK